MGGVVSTPGRLYTNIINRALERENRPQILNFGFAGAVKLHVIVSHLFFFFFFLKGNGKMELNVAEFLVEIDASLFIIDCNPNLNALEVANRTEPLVHFIRNKWPELKIVLVEGTTYGGEWILENTFEGQLRKREALATAYENLKKEGLKNLYYVKGNLLFGIEENE